MKKSLIVFSLAAGVASQAASTVVFNEIMYRPVNPGAAYVELFNTSSNTAVALDGWRLSPLNYTFPVGANIPPQGFLVLARNRTAFTNAYGASTPVFDEFSGQLATNGAVLTLLLPGVSTNDPALIVDQVRYEGLTPWSTNANGTGSSLQLIDPDQDNSRAANWGARFVPGIPTGGLIPRDGWRFHSASGSIGGGENTGGEMRLVIFLGEAGSALIDDLAIVAGTNAGVGFNYVSNGNFEASLVLADTNFVPTNGWRIGTNYTNTLIVHDLVHSGSGALKIVGDSTGFVTLPTFNNSISQLLSPAPPRFSTNTLSFWYWATNSATNLYVRIRNSAALGTAPPGTGPTNINVFYVVNAGPPIPATNYFSPGSNNTTRATLPAFPSVWLNALQADNITGLLDRFGERDPWIEIYNSGSNAISLNGLYLSAGYTNLTHWAFPPDANLTPGQLFIVFCDGQSIQTSGTEYHTSFRLPAVSGSVALSRLVNGAAQVIDYINYAGLPANHMYRSLPDGQPFFRQDYFRPPTIVSEDATGTALNPVTHLGELTASAGIHPNGLATTTFLQYGVTTSYGLATAPVPLAATLTNVTVGNPLVLGPGLIWHYRLVAQNAAGSTNGPDRVVAVSVPGDLNGDGTVSRAELENVYAGYAVTSPWLLMTNVAGLGGTNVSFALTNSLEGSYTVESTTNLSDWQPLGPAFPRYLFIDTNAPTQSQRYYRLRWP